MDLKAVQSEFSKSIYDGTRLGSLAQIIRPAGSLSNVEAAVDVYRSAYQARLTEALEECHAVTAKSLGWEVFQKICTAYIETHPPWSYNLSHFGQEFAQFLASDPSLPKYISDLARFDRCHFELFHTEPPRSASPDRFGLLEGNPNAALRFGNGFKLFSSSNSIFSYWSHISSGEQSPTPSMEERAEYLAIYRFEAGVFVRSLDNGQFDICQRLLQGFTLEGALAVDSSLLKIHEDNVSQLFSFLVSSGVIEDVVV